MRAIRKFPHPVREIEHTLIPMQDGTRLAARIWLPEGAEAEPVPAVLEYIPYRKRDTTALRDERIHRYVAGHGYACVRVDIRGSGDSEGVLTDEYLQSELDDGLQILRWLAEQPWCTGKVGLFGKSWGGFNGLQLAALQPPELGAVITVCSTDDRYADDVHYMGGCLLGDNQSWAATMLSHTSLPPDPELVGERWRAMWMQRLEQGALWLDTWLEHPHRDSYWRHGSICEDYDAIQVPVMAVSGWADGYSNSVFRLLENLKVPRQGLVGPWSHRYPHQGLPGPAIGFLQECVRWWDHWLKGRDSQIMNEPMLRAWMQNSVTPTTYYDRRGGRWVAEPEWPTPHVEQRRYGLRYSHLCPEHEQGEPTGDEPTIQSPLSVGLFAGKWCSFTATPDLPHDQREEDGGALVFTTAPLEEDLEILGAPAIELLLSSNKPVAMVAVRLSDVQPDDKATRVTYGLLNLTHHESHSHPRPLEPGKPFRARFLLNEVAQAFPKGHRLRISISTSYWPIAWPPPEPARLTIHADYSRITLPVRPRRPDEPAPEFGPAEGAASASMEVLRPKHYDWLVKRDLARDISELEVVKDEGRYRLKGTGTEVEARVVERYRYEADDFGSATGETFTLRRRTRGDWDVWTETTTRLTCDSEAFFVHATLDAYDSGERVFSRNWSKRIPRKLL